MTDQELLRKLQSDDDSDLLKELRQKLDAELAKPVAEQDFDYIDDLAKTIDAITGADQETAEIADRGIQSIKAELHNQPRKHRIKRLRWWIPAACLILIVGTNIWTYTAFGMNAFSAAYQILNGGINVDLNSRDSADVYSGNPYADDMNRICAENGADILIPSYIPEGFKPTDGYGEVSHLSDSLLMSFYFSKSNKKLSVVVTLFYETTELPPVGIPTDHYEVSEQIIQNTLITVMKEDDQYTAAFTIDKTQYIIYSDHLDYDECQRVLYSFFE